jgi:hypothetical protein
MHDKNRRLPGEAAFSLALLALSLWLTTVAFDISGFEALSAPGTFPLAVTVVLVITSGMIFWRTLRLPAAAHIRNWREILPLRVVGMALLVGLYALALKPLGFLPTSFGFLTISIWALGRTSIGYALGIAALSVAGIYVIFRLIFTVLMPEGVVPEREIIAWVQHLLAGGGK